MTIGRRAVLCVVLLLLMTSVPIFACSTTLGYRDVSFYISEIRVATSNFPDDAAIGGAAAFWNSGCSGSAGGYDYPTVAPGFCSGSGCIQISVDYVTGQSQTATGGCAVYQDYQAGQSTGGTITVYEYDITGRPCSQDWLYSLEHELGHALGLDHPPNGDLGEACFDDVMGNHSWATPYSSLDFEDCNNIDHEWYTPTEEHVDEEQATLDTCESACASHCEETLSGSYYCPGNGESPIIVDLGGDGFTLTSPENGVWFDLSARRRPERVAWTSAIGGDAFLCRDRNGDGVIGDGRELFGNATPLANGHKAPNGFVALQEFDTPSLGGNGDGQLDSSDRIWETLRLWIDTNHDGVSQPSELITLSQASVVSIDLHYIRSAYSDENGNLFRFRAKAILSDHTGRLHPSRIYDVFLSTTSNPSSGTPGFDGSAVRTTGTASLPPTCYANEVCATPTSTPTPTTPTGPGRPPR